MGAKEPGARSAVAEAAIESAREAGLRYVCDRSPGISRVASAAGFAYVGPDGRRLSDEATVSRIRSLAIPPAYRDVWICPFANGHIQAVGRDARGRKQYRYHARWRELRDEHKYGRLIAFARALPRIRKRTRRDLARPGMPREKVLATVVQILEKTLIRVGNDEYARHNGSYGLTTLRNRHARVGWGRVRLQFRGKSGKPHAVELDDPRLAKIVRDCQELPGHELFEYVDEAGEVRGVGSAEVNAYLRDIAGEEFTAKDFRTWGGTVLAARALRESGSFASATEAKRNVVAAIERVAGELRNTKAVCRKCYVHPEVLNAYLEGTLARALGARNGRARAGKSPVGLSAEESTVLRLLEQRLRLASEPLSRRLEASIAKLRAQRKAGAERNAHAQ